MLDDDAKWFAVSLCITGDALDPTQLESLLGLQPDTVGIMGQPRMGKQGRQYAPYETNLWSYRDRAFAYVSSPAVLGDRVLIGGRDKRLHCLRTKDGEALWTFGTRGKVDSSPVICDGKVVVGSEDGRLYLVSLADGKELWSYEIGQGLTASPAVADGKVVIGSEDGSVYCFGVKAK